MNKKKINLREITSFPYQDQGKKKKNTIKKTPNPNQFLNTAPVKMRKSSIPSHPIPFEGS